MMIRKPLATAAVLAALAALALPLAGCGSEDSGPTEREQATATAIALRQQADAEVRACATSGTYIHTCFREADSKYPGSCAAAVGPSYPYETVTPSRDVLDPSRVSSCATDLLAAKASGTPFPTPTSTTTATPAPQASSTSDGSSTLGNLAGWLIILGIPGGIGYLIYRRVAADRAVRAHAHAVHQSEGSWQYDDSGDHYTAAPQQHDQPAPDHNPWA